MSLIQILAAFSAALLYRLIARLVSARRSEKTAEWGRLPFLFTASVLVVYGLQPSLPIRGLDYWLPTLTLALTVICWAAVTPREERNLRVNSPALLGLLAAAVLIALTGLMNLPSGLLSLAPPPLLQAGIGLAVLAFLIIISIRINRDCTGWLLGLLIALFILLKTPALAAGLSTTLRGLAGQNTAGASSVDLRWLGFSYLAFRLIHTLRDRQSGRLPAVNLAEFLIYVVFFSSFTSGPIDRLERFIKDLRSPTPLDSTELGEAFRRLILGLFKKFVLADTLAIIALNPQIAGQVIRPAWLWVLLYAYTLQIYFDFSGYTDIALGTARVLGIHLPENFNHPYRRANLTLFWNNWHMTLTQWVRAYFFNPVTRWLRVNKPEMNPATVMFTGQIGTMLLIGLWHGVTWNFIIWGLWHGLGLFVQNRWSDWAKRSPLGRVESARGKRWLTFGGWLLTFHYVAFGWVWFCLPDPASALRVFAGLFGVG
ncbi:MAG: MBOAT family protein [Leptolinea sp.]|nr:MBOAT family protein [Leptolinea sp.]